MGPNLVGIGKRGCQGDSGSVTQARDFVDNSFIVEERIARSLSHFDSIREEDFPYDDFEGEEIKLDRHA